MDPTLKEGLWYGLFASIGVIQFTRRVYPRVDSWFSSHAPASLTLDRRFLRVFSSFLTLGVVVAFLHGVYSLLTTTVGTDMNGNEVKSEALEVAWIVNLTVGVFVGVSSLILLLIFFCICVRGIRSTRVFFAGRWCWLLFVFVVFGGGMLFVLWQALPYEVIIRLAEGGENSEADIVPSCEPEGKEMLTEADKLLESLVFQDEPVYWPLQDPAVLLDTNDTFLWINPDFAGVLRNWVGSGSEATARKTHVRVVTAIGRQGIGKSTFFNEEYGVNLPVLPDDAEMSSRTTRGILMVMPAMNSHVLLLDPQGLWSREIPEDDVEQIDAKIALLCLLVGNDVMVHVNVDETGTYLLRNSILSQLFDAYLHEKNNASSFLHEVSAFDDRRRRLILAVHRFEKKAQFESDAIRKSVLQTVEDVWKSKCGGPETCASSSVHDEFDVEVHYFHSLTDRPSYEKDLNALKLHEKSLDLRGVRTLEEVIRLFAFAWVSVENDRIVNRPSTRRVFETRDADCLTKLVNRVIDDFQKVAAEDGVFPDSDTLEDEEIDRVCYLDKIPEARLASEREKLQKAVGELSDFRRHLVELICCSVFVVVYGFWGIVRVFRIWWSSRKLCLWCRVLWEAIYVVIVCVSTLLVVRIIVRMFIAKFIPFLLEWNLWGFDYVRKSDLCSYTWNVTERALDSNTLARQLPSIVLENLFPRAWSWACGKTMMALSEVSILGFSFVFDENWAGKEVEFGGLVSLLVIIVLGYVYRAVFRGTIVHFTVDCFDDATTEFKLDVDLVETSSKGAAGESRMGAILKEIRDVALEYEEKRRTAEQARRRRGRRRRRRRRAPFDPSIYEEFAEVRVRGTEKWIALPRNQRPTPRETRLLFSEGSEFDVRLREATLGPVVQRNQRNQ